MKYVEAEAALSATERATVNAHLSACPSCHEEAAMVRAMGALLRTRGPVALPVHTPAPDLWDRIEGRIVSEQRESRRAVSLRPVLLFAPAFAAIIVAVVLMPKQNSVPTSSSSPVKEEAIALTTFKKTTPMVAMNEAGTTRSLVVASPSTKPVTDVMKMKSGNQEQAARRTTMVAAMGRQVGATTSARPRTQSTGIALAFNAELKPRNKKKIPLVAQNSLQSEAIITIVDVAATPTPTLVASARTSAPEPRPVVPDADEHTRSFALSDLGRNPITVVESDPGTGVTSAAYTAPPVTDTMIRQRQRRGLFGGYGAGSAAIATLPATSGTGTGSGSSSPW